jgi:hypothetical protein
LFQEAISNTPTVAPAVEEDEALKGETCFRRRCPLLSLHQVITSLALPDIEDGVAE